ncbi:MAG: hypothetical protein KTR20_04020 [Cellvibrionaceae bacterium]|nr:hypothetical protein [Cellvibrionaceae bacterium]
MTARHPPLTIEPLVVDQPLISVAIEGDANVDAVNSDYIRVHSFEGQEGISQPFQFSLELRADDSENAELCLDSRYMGHWARVRIAMPKDSLFAPRYFRGVITEVALAAAGVYTLSLQSPLHLLGLRNDYRIIGDCDIRQLITHIFAEELTSPGFVLRFDFSHSPTLTRTQDWMQAGESSMDFLQRILGKAFINYFFIHEESRLTLVFSDKTMTENTVAIPGYRQGPLPLRYTFTEMDALALQQYDVFAQLRYSVKMMPPKAKTLLAQIDPEWKDNTVADFHSFSAQGHEPGTAAYHHYWHYDYGVNDAEARDQLTKIYQQMATEATSLSGSVFTPLLSPGYCFRLSNPLLTHDHSDAKGRPEFDGKTYVVTKIQHKASSASGYSGSVESTEVNMAGSDYEKTLLTPFSMQSTQRGSVLAKVLDHAQPVGWRYRSKNNFQPEKGQVFFEGEPHFQGECHGEAGCLVELATGQKHWVVLPRSSQTVPEINAMVLIGRGSSESEQPELQQVLASHGTKTIQPPDRRNASWQANTQWGSNYSTSYGDSLSIHYSHNAQTDLEKAIRLVEGAYDKPGMAATNYGSASYNKGGAWSVSISDNQQAPDVGLLSASIAQGSNFSEAHSAHNYSYSATQLGESYSETGKTANVSVVGKYTDAPDLDTPSFVDGQLPKDISEYSGQLSQGDSFTRSCILGRSINCQGVGISAPDVSISSILPGTHFSSSFTLGISENNSKTLGATLTNSLMVGVSASNSVNCAAQMNNALTIGPTITVDTRLGSVNSLSTTVGNHKSISTQVANNFSLGTTIGSSTTIQTNLSANASLNTTLGRSSDMSTYIGSKQSLDTFIGSRSDTSVSVSGRKSTSVAVGTSQDTSVNVAAKSSTNIFVGATQDTSINVAARKSTNISVGISDDTSINVAASKSQNISIADKTETSISLGNTKSLSLNLSNSLSMENSLSSSIAMRNSISASLELINSLSSTVKIINQASADLEVVNGVTKAASDLRPQVKTRGTIIEIIAGIDVKL